MPTVLVIDDDPLVALSVRDAAPAWTVLEAADGAAGVATFRAQRDQVDEVLLDLSMPHDGVMTCIQIRTDAAVPIVPITGGAPEVTLRMLSGLGCAPPLYKPVALADLADALLQALRLPRRTDPPDPAVVLAYLRELAARSEYAVVQQRPAVLPVAVLASSEILRSGLRDSAKAAGALVQTATTRTAALRNSLAACQAIALVADSGIAHDAAAIADLHGVPLLLVARTLRAAYRAAATVQGVVIEPVAPTTMATALATLAAGDRYRDPILDRPLLPDLTKAEHAVLVQLLRGMPVPTIAAHLHIQPNSVQKHRSSICAKAGVADLDELCEWLESQRFRHPA